MLQVNRRDVIITIVVILAGLAFVAYSQADITTKRTALRVFADGHERELLEGLDPADIDRLVEIDSGKSNVVFGSDWGVIRLYTRAKGDASMDSFTGVEYFYEHKDGNWNLLDTARIELPEHIYDGYRKFEEAGYDVDESAYLRYNS